MREVNLRFWDKREKSYVENPFYLDILPIDDGDDGFEMVHSVDLDDESSFIPEQCTGLIDESGHEIYEGDIVRVADINSYAYTDEVKHETNALPVPVGAESLAVDEGLGGDAR